MLITCFIKFIPNLISKIVYQDILGYDFKIQGSHVPYNVADFSTQLIGSGVDIDRIPGIDIALNDGDSWMFGGHEALVIGTHGHTRAEGCFAKTLEKAFLNACVSYLNYAAVGDTDFTEEPATKVKFHTSLSLPEFLPNFHSLVLTNNRLVNLNEIDLLASLLKLTFLSLLDNNITKKPNYRLYVIHKLKSLRVLDFKKVKQKIHLFLPKDPYERITPRFWANFLDDKLLVAVLKFIKSKSREQDVIEEIHELLSLLQNELGDKKFFGGESIGLVDIAANIVALWLDVIQEGIGKDIFTRETYPNFFQWIEEYMN
ncbi:hypothetical protein POM88_047903 [Heracleum sosnowskyi]|uniref:GST C-terminal domain-containing protein n=1 Tax=Heracleum sosnowskyi TaxID=360622 RepID=A0AAD8M031_9APIA|nr:hypothetical protein POM88_047903 [Heracleum sosnowskyi]